MKATILPWLFTALAIQKILQAVVLHLHSCTEPRRCSSWSLIRKNNLLLKYYGFQFCFYAFSSVQKCVFQHLYVFPVIFLWLFFLFLLLFCPFIVFYFILFYFYSIIIIQFPVCIQMRERGRNVWTLMGGEVGRIQEEFREEKP